MMSLDPDEEIFMLRYILKRLDVPAVIRWMVLIAWMGVFLIYLLQSEAHPVLSTGIPPGPYSPERDAFFSSVHLMAYIVTTLLWVWTLITMLPFTRALITTFIIVISMGFSTEVLQTLTPDRHFQLIDLAANSSGLMIGLIAFAGVYRWYHQPQPQPLG